MDEREKVLAAAETGARIASDFAEVLRHHEPPIHADVIARLMGMVLGCMAGEQQKTYFKAIIEMSAHYTADNEKAIAAMLSERKH